MGVTACRDCPCEVECEAQDACPHLLCWWDGEVAWDAAGRECTRCTEREQWRLIDEDEQAHDDAVNRRVDEARGT